MSTTTKFVSTQTTPAEQLMCEISGLYLSMLRAYSNGCMPPEIIATVVLELTGFFNSGKDLYLQENINLAELYAVVGKLKFYQPPKCITFTPISEFP